MYRSHNCGELRAGHIGEQVSLAGWVQIARNLGGMTFIDLRDRYGITQLAFNMEENEELCQQARKAGREYVIQITGIVRERSNKNLNRPTGEIEIQVNEFKILNTSQVPPFTIEDQTDGGDDIRMKYRYLDIRRSAVKEKLMFRHQIALETRKYLSQNAFIEIETPYLIKSTPEGARDFVVPSRMNGGQFYALPQSPQTFKQLLMVAGMDKYFQIVRCFRDEDLRADRQPEFTQIDCEMSFVEREDILNMFEGLMRHLFKVCLDFELEALPRMSYDDAIKYYGSDKPDLRFDLKFIDLNLLKGYGFPVFDEAELVTGFIVKGLESRFSNKELNELTEWVKRPQIGAKGLAYIKMNSDGTIKSTIAKFYTEDQIKAIAENIHLASGDIMFILSGNREKTLKQLGELRLEIGRRMDLIKANDFKPLWVLDFPLLEWDEDKNRFFAMHHPFTSPLPNDIEKMHSKDKNVLSSIRADAYDLVINGAELGGGSIRIHNRQLQSINFGLLGFTPEEAEEQFGFLLGAFEYGAPPHGGIAFGLDRVCSIMQGTSTIRDFIAFPKNNQGRDVMIDAPSFLTDDQLSELQIKVQLTE
ncbi:MAG: aspartate--tRNA ligase [Saprospiraceae bacterium]|uniref:Aspartate--tRNA ligase n=1 Tax=Candidatus Defluviibacterium haderslevense TaxID=2981993 RepID=A0A9D7S6D1_9BACT|nr:aspartate--tRNA ligase [Candidatus Defluviibacterium haderslevense]